MVDAPGALNEPLGWDEEKLRGRCQQLVATEHAHPDAIGAVDESGVAKSGSHRVGGGRDLGVVGADRVRVHPPRNLMLDWELACGTWTNDHSDNPPDPDGGRFLLAHSSHGR